MSQKIGEAFIEITAKLDQLEASIKGEIQSIGSKAGQQFTSGFQSSLQGLSGALAGVVSLSAIKQLGGEILGLANNLQQSHIAFTTMLGSAEQSEKLLTELSDFASKTPFELQGVRENAKQLLAMGVSSEQLLPTLKSLGDVSAGLSVPLERLAINYGQVMTQGKLTGREMRDFMMAGVPLADELAKNLGVAKEKIGDMISSGQISANDVTKAFQTMSSEGGRFADMMDQQSKSLGGLVSNLKDEIAITGETIGSQFLPMASDIVKSISGIMEKVREWVQEHPALTKAIVSFVAVGGTLLGVLGLVGGAIGVLGPLFGALAGPVGLAIAGVAGLTAVGVGLTASMNTTKSTIDTTGKSYNELTEAIKENEKKQKDLKKEYEEFGWMLYDYEDRLKELEYEHSELQEAQDDSTMSLEEMRAKMEEVKNSELNTADKVAELEKIRLKALETASALIEAKKRLDALGAKLKQERKEEQAGLRTENLAGGMVSQSQMLYNQQDFVVKGLEQIYSPILEIANEATDAQKEYNKELEKTNNLVGGSGSGSSKKNDALKAEQALLKEAEKAYADIDKAIDKHNKNIEKAQDEIKKLSEKYNELKSKAKDAFHEAVNSVKELNKELADNEQAKVDSLGARYLEIQEKLRDMKLDNEGMKRMDDNFSIEQIKSFMDAGDKELNGVDLRKVLEFKELQEELVWIKENSTVEEYKNIEATKEKTKAQEILNKHLEKAQEIEAKKAEMLEKQAILSAFDRQEEGQIKVFSGEKDGELKARYENETGTMVEITDFKNVQYAQDLFNKSEALRLEKEQVKQKIEEEKRWIEEYNIERGRLEREFTNLLTVEVNKQKGVVQGLIDKYRELARAKVSAGIASGARAFGGEVKAGLPYLVGENFKPELFIPSSSGSVVPVNNYNQSKSYSFSGVTINSNNAEDFWSQIQNHIGDYT